MPRQSNGSYLQPGGTSAVTNTVISSTADNTLVTDIGTEIGNSVDRLGRGSMAANLNLGGYKINNLLGGVLPTDAANVAQLANLGQITRATAIGTNIPVSTPVLFVSGFATAGDGGECMYVKLSGAPGAPSQANFQSLDGAYWQIVSPFIYPQMVGPVGAADDSTTLAYASVAALSIGAQLRINQVHKITAAINFGAYVYFDATGRIKPSAVGQVKFSAGFEAPLHAFIFDFSLVAAGQTNSGFATASVTARELTPQMFGAVENSPSSSVANVKPMNDWCAAVSASRIPGFIPPVYFNIGGQVVFDYYQGELEGIMLRGSGGSSRLKFDTGVTSPNLKFTSTGPGVSGQAPEFYGEIGYFQVSGVPTAAGGYPATVLQFGEVSIVQSGPNAGGSPVYFNELNIRGITVNNNTSGGWATVMTGFANCDVMMNSNCITNTNDGSASFVWINTNYNKMVLGPGNSQYGIYSPAVCPNDAGSHVVYNYSNFCPAYDGEVQKTAIYNRSSQFSNNVFQGTFNTNDYLVDSTAGQGNIIDFGSEFSAIALGTFANMAGGIGTFGGYGFTIKAANYNFWGQAYPFATVVNPAIATGTWIVNVYGQDYMVYITCNQTFTLFKRTFFDRSSAGTQYGLYFTSGNYIQVPLLVKAGESFMVTSAGTISYNVEPKE